MAEVSIRPVRTRRELKRFVKVPFRLHRDNPQWVAPLIFERMEFLNREKNPYFEHAEAEYFIAERDGEPVGRITAQVDERWDEYQGGSDAMFGFFESRGRPRGRRGAARRRAEWARGKGRARMLGPMDFTTNDEVGILIEGYERRPMILEPWHPPYYRELIEAAGLRQGDGPADVGAAVRRPQGGRAVRPLDPRRRREGAARTKGSRSATCASATWRARCGASWTSTTRPGATTGASSRSPTPRSSFQAKNLKQVIDEDWAFIAEKDGEVVGAALTLPDINQVMAKMNGRLLPFGWLHFLLGKRKIDQLPRLRARRQARLPAHRRRRRPLPQAPRDGGEARRRSTAARWAGSWRPTSR